MSGEEEIEAPSFSAFLRQMREVLTAAPGDVALVVRVYRDLLPSGKVHPSVPGALARLHDLSTLEQLGVPVDPALARDAVAEAEGWVAQIAEGAAAVSPRP